MTNFLIDISYEISNNLLINRTVKMIINCFMSMRTICGYIWRLLTLASANGVGLFAMGSLTSRYYRLCQIHIESYLDL
jgi:hypothetical protein